jgi:hypothetical protein
MFLYPFLLFVHSLFRWLVLGFLFFALFRGWAGWKKKKHFSRLDDFVRHVTATVAHLQLAIGITLYFTSPIIKYFLSDFRQAVGIPELSFFGIVHSSMMLVAVILITLGSSLAKRKKTDEEKFRTMVIWFSLALCMILVAIPWPFSPLAMRPYFRPY